VTTSLFVVHKATTYYDKPAHRVRLIMFTHYEDMKGNVKCRNFGVFIGDRVTPSSAYDFLGLFDFNRHYASIWYRFRVIASC